MSPAPRPSTTKLTSLASYEAPAYATRAKTCWRRGLLNFAGWLALTSHVTLAYQRLETDANAADAFGPGDTGDLEAGRAAALLLLSYYLPAAV
jgi:hypothetical protein